eukprot:TRINITY_DN12407_c0_g1_i1.p1 TRINITY_DN12407_c0_g1~~TRINITY_DN12407_c0_g1_i1.p1  ORF type:complete len:205 (+),score=34.01 TRINITY_DN12407_c0_g1_i1:64-678(+)
MDAHSHKVVLLGSSGSGKTCIVLRATRNSFDHTAEATIGASYFILSVVTKGVVVKLEVWDTAGQERYSFLSSMYYRGASVALVLYDITTKSSYNRAKQWIDEVMSQISDSSKTRVVLVGNKVDLHLQRAVQKEEACEYANQKGIQYLETSAYNGQNVGELFQIAAQECLSLNRPTAILSSDQSTPTTPVISTRAQDEPRSNCIC